MNGMEWKVTKYEELGRDELYNILSLRAEVFVVEQDCVYQDVDGKDHKAVHISGYEGDLLVAYCRIFPSGEYFENTAVGRVAVRKEYRAKGYGHSLMQLALGEIYTIWGAGPVTISAQLYLEKFYNSHGFERIGSVYQEDGIDHIRMVRI